MSTLLVRNAKLRKEKLQKLNVVNTTKKESTEKPVLNKTKDAPQKKTETTK